MRYKFQALLCYLGVIFLVRDRKLPLSREGMCTLGEMKKKKKNHLSHYSPWHSFLGSSVTDSLIDSVPLWITFPGHLLRSVPLSTSSSWGAKLQLQNLHLIALPEQLNLFSSNNGFWVQQPPIAFSEVTKALLQNSPKTSAYCIKIMTIKDSILFKLLSVTRSKTLNF